MAIYTSNHLNGIDILKDEGILIDSSKYKKLAKTIGIINLMPNKSETEVQILRLLGNCNEDLNIEFIRLESYKSTTSDYEYMINNYATFDEIKGKLHGVIITGAPLEKLDFDEVLYIDELRDILDYVRKNIRASLYICWGAQVALNYFYNVRKELKEDKIFGVFSHEVLKSDDILNGIKNGFKAPHSRHTCLNRQDIKSCKELSLICVTDEDEEHIIKGSFNDYYILGHCEYDENTLKGEYLRDLDRGLMISVPKHYFENNDINSSIKFSWRDDGIKIYKNWIDSIKV
ncbi:homoserine O-succinyltransferase [Clostridium sp. AL.422]|uniref:homoserine O-acetyltransferase/O-succinyltransferase family protein n=1 Tax=Clostridium TaxID=1485 RepID=UPI00293DA68D|nr:MULTISPECIES: homoserine O-succinyltransferase [unclassified Clostridium]MDV4150771.1 homoserine O-succinyltransferase [Clostridium sp. AL.422]